jgi:hypothetical protein
MGALPATAQVADRALEDRILALDPDRVTAADVRQTLVRGPTPRIMLLHGGIYPVHLSMESFGNFLVGMGYPEARIRDPRDGSWSHSPYTDADQLAGMLAWYYEKDGMPPMLIGHSQGGMQAVKILYVLDGYYEAPVRVWNPMTDQAEPRTSFKDPLTGRETPVVHGFKVVYASAVGAGGAAFLLPNQWAMIGKLHTIPDTIEEFTGYAIALDLWDGRRIDRKSGARHRRGPRHRPRHRAEARARPAATSRQLLQQRRRGRGAVREIRALGRRACAIAGSVGIPTASTRCSPSSASTSTGSTSSSATPPAAC